MRKSLESILAAHRDRVDSLDLQLLCARGIGKSREFVLTHPEYEIDQRQSAIIESFIRRRASREPLAHILGSKEFFGLDFSVTKDTLIPRPETELLVEEILHGEKSAKKQNKPSLKKTLFIDVGTGSGCIVISLARELSKNNALAPYEFFGLDISSKAIAIAKKNARKHSLEKNISFLRSDLLESVSKKILSETFDRIVIAGNLPYLSQAVYDSSPKDVREFEPKTALCSGENGLQHYRKLLEQMQSIRARKNTTAIHLFFEISPEQKVGIGKLVRHFFPKGNVLIKKDLAGKNRLAIIALSN